MPGTPKQQCQKSKAWISASISAATLASGFGIDETLHGSGFRVTIRTSLLLLQLRGAGLRAPEYLKPQTERDRKSGLGNECLSWSLIWYEVANDWNRLRHHLRA